MLRFYEQKRKSGFRQFVFYINVIVFIVSAGYLLNYFNNGRLNRKSIDRLNKLVEDVQPQVDEEGNVDRYGSVREQYPDLAGRLTYRYYNKEMLLPVMQTDNNDDYIRSDCDKNPSDAGTPFFDYRCDVKNSLILVVYAHNMNDLSQFGALKEYKRKNYWQKYKTVILETKYEEPVEYEVVAAFYSRIYKPGDKAFRYYAYFDFKDKETYDYYIENIKKLALYDTGIVPEYGDKLLLMSTCDYVQGIDNGRFAVLARKTTKTVKSEEELKFDNKTATPEETQKPDDEDNNTSNNSNNNTTQTKKPVSRTTPKPVVTKAPTKKPTATPKPTPKPTPTLEPTPKPTVEPTQEPTEQPDPIDPPGDESFFQPW